LLAQLGWPAVTGMAAVAALIALAIRFWKVKPEQA